MKRILITGNGFDLNHYLPTSYGDIMNIYKYILSKEESFIFNFDNIYKECGWKYAKILERYKKFEFDTDLINEVRVILKKNLWFKFFLKEYNIETWIDFENKIEFVITKIYDSLIHFYYGRKSFSTSSVKISEYSEKLLITDESNNYRYDTVNMLEAFEVFNREGEGISRFKLGISKKYLVKREKGSAEGRYIDIDFTAIYNDLIKELEEFKRVFNLYFEIFVFPFYDNLKEQMDPDIFKLVSHHFTFNYTPTFEKFYNIDGCKTDFLHGRIEEGQNKIVLGVNEIPENGVGEKYFIPFTKYYQKLYLKCDYNFLTDFGGENVHFYFFGHSLDTSDKYYIDAVFDHLNYQLKNGRRDASTDNKITIIHHDDESRSRLLINLIAIRGQREIVELHQRGFLEFFLIDSPELKISLTSKRRSEFDITGFHL